MSVNYPLSGVFSRFLIVSGMILATIAGNAHPTHFPDSTKQISQNDSTALGNSLYESGIAYGLQSKYKESIIAQQKAFVIYQRIGNNTGAIKALLSLGYSNFKLKKYPDAKQLYTRALERSRRNSDFEQMVEAYDGLAKVYEAQKDYKKAIASVRLMQGAYDSIANRDHRQKLDQLEEKYSKQLEEKDRQLVTAEAQRQQAKTDRLLRLIERDDIQLTFYSVALALTFLVFCFAIGWLFTQRTAKVAQNKLRREQASTKMANEQFETISGQIREELMGGQDVSFLMDIVWLMNPNVRSLDSLVAYIKESANIFLTKSGINYMIVVPDKIPNMQLTSLERVNLFSVTMELVRNAVNCSKARGLTLSIALEGKQMIFKVKDNSTPVNETTIRKRSEELKPLRDKMEQVDGTIGIVMEQGSMVVIYRKDLT